jgi:hypothetical protein
MARNRTEWILIVEKNIKVWLVFEGMISAYVLKS